VPVTGRYVVAANVRAEMNGAQLPFERGDSESAGMQLGRADPTGAERDLKPLLLSEDLLAQAPRLTTLSGVQNVTRPRISVQLGGTGTSHPPIFPQVGDLLIAQAPNLGVHLISVRRPAVRADATDDT
jgi:hypothetical protein